VDERRNCISEQILGIFVLGWLGLVAGWWILIPAHLSPEGETERSKRLKLLLAEQSRQAEKIEEVARVTPPVPLPGPAVEDPTIKAGRAVYQDFECDNCHRIGEQGWKKRKGPLLDNIGNLVTAEQLKGKLWDPMIWYAEGFEKEYKKVVMPDNYPEIMSEAERDALVAYLMTLKDPAGKTPSPVFPAQGERR
jgi:mono/diheme cytochrome c family protein